LRILFKKCILTAVIDEMKIKYKVSEITELIKNTLESNFYGISIEGEISNFRPSSTGHYYFSLKDKDSIIQAVMFRNRINLLDFQPFDGQLVVVEGNISVYAKRGTYQIIAEKILKAGIGDLLRILEDRKRRFAELGFFDAERKKNLPLFPERVAVVTSPTGAAIRDILNVLKRRNSKMNLIVLPTAVQGEDAGVSIASQIRTADRFKLADVIILTRGGGSLEDLLPFSDEEVIKAVAGSTTPVISAVGHEIDIVLSDLAADFRAPTPSAAAEIVTESSDNIFAAIQAARESIEYRFIQRIEKIKVLLKHFSAKNLEQTFRVILQPFLLRLDDAKESMLRHMELRIKDTRYRVNLLSKDISAGSPHEILKKGYALVRKKDVSQIVRTPDEVVPGDDIDIFLAKGKIGAEVKETKA
jgi:exodeoxyribonuclease VII large subunit